MTTFGNRVYHRTIRRPKLQMLPPLSVLFYGWTQGREQQKLAGVFAGTVSHGKSGGFLIYLTRKYPWKAGDSGTLALEHCLLATHPDLDS